MNSQGFTVGGAYLKISRCITISSTYTHYHVRLPDWHPRVVGTHCGSGLMKWVTSTTSQSITVTCVRSLSFMHVCVCVCVRVIVPTVGWTPFACTIVALRTWNMV